MVFLLEIEITSTFQTPAFLPASSWSSLLLAPHFSHFVLQKPYSFIDHTIPQLFSLPSDLSDLLAA